LECACCGSKNKKKYYIIHLLSSLACYDCLEKLNFTEFEKYFQENSPREIFFKDNNHSDCYLLKTEDPVEQTADDAGWIMRGSLIC